MSRRVVLALSFCWAVRRPRLPVSAGGGWQGAGPHQPPGGGPGARPTPGRGLPPGPGGLPPGVRPGPALRHGPGAKLGLILRGPRLRGGGRRLPSPTAERFRPQGPAPGPYLQGPPPAPYRSPRRPPPFSKRDRPSLRRGGPRQLLATADAGRGSTRTWTAPRRAARPLPARPGGRTRQPPGPRFRRGPVRRPGPRTTCRGSPRAFLGLWVTSPFTRQKSRGAAGGDARPASATVKPPPRFQPPSPARLPPGPPLERPPFVGESVILEVGPPEAGSSRPNASRGRGKLRENVGAPWRERSADDFPRRPVSSGAGDDPRQRRADLGRRPSGSSARSPRKSARQRCKPITSSLRSLFQQGPERPGAGGRGGHGNAIGACCRQAPRPDGPS